jgi:hypothetical protein
MDDPAFRAFLQRLLPLPARPVAATPDMLKAWHTRCAGIESDREALAAIREEGGDTGAAGLRIAPAPPTKWGALNAVTAWIDHFARPERNFVFATFGQGTQVKERAYQLLTAAQPAA